MVSARSLCEAITSLTSERDCSVLLRLVCKEVMVASRSWRSSSKLASSSNCCRFYNSSTDFSATTSANSSRIYSPSLYTFLNSVPSTLSLRFSSKSSAFINSAFFYPRFNLSLFSLSLMRNWFRFISYRFLLSASDKIPRMLLYCVVKAESS